MKRKNSRYRAMPFSERVVEPINKLDPNLFRFPSASEHPGVRARKIFVIKQTRRLSSTDAAGKKVQRILIFDDHPDSLRLVFGRCPSPHVDLSSPPRGSSWELILVGVLFAVLLIAMFWPLL